MTKGASQRENIFGYTLDMSTHLMYSVPIRITPGLKLVFKTERVEERKSEKPKNTEYIGYAL